MPNNFWDRIGRGTRWWNQGEAEKPNGNFFVFVEEAALVPAKGLIGPAGTPVQLSDPTERLWRFRTSGIAVHEFLTASEAITPVDHLAIDQAARATRRSELQSGLGDVTLPVIDILIDEDHESLHFARAIFTPGAWYWIGVRPRLNLKDRWEVHIDTPIKSIIPGEAASLLFIEAVPPYFEYRLRDIFSLAHIGDADDDGTGLGGAGPGDKPPDEPDPQYEVNPRDQIEKRTPDAGWPKAPLQKET